jgi:hypothetical protein
VNHVTPATTEGRSSHEREAFSSRTVFILAAMGSAIGLGNRESGSFQRCIYTAFSGTAVNHVTPEGLQRRASGRGGWQRTAMPPRRASSTSWTQI